MVCVYVRVCVCVRACVRATPRASRSTDLDVALLMRLASHGPLQGDKEGMENLHFVRPNALDGSFLRQTDGTVLQRSEHGGGDQLVVHTHARATVQTVDQQLGCLDRHRSQLKLPIQDIAAGVDVRHARLLRSGDDLAVLGRLNTNRFKVQARGVRNSA